MPRVTQPTAPRGHPPLWVCTGREVISKTMLGYQFRTVNGVVLGPVVALLARGLKNIIAGGVYEVEDGQPTTFREMWHDDRQVFNWQAQARVAEITHRAQKRATGNTRNLIAERLEPLRNLYQATDRTGKLALEVLILDELRHGERGGR